MIKHLASNEGQSKYFFILYNNYLCEERLNLDQRTFLQYKWYFRTRKALLPEFLYSFERSFIGQRTLVSGTGILPGQTDFLIDLLNEAGIFVLVVVTKMPAYAQLYIQCYFISMALSRYCGSSPDGGGPAA